jgi:putative MATE family efflux protein
VFVGRLGVTPLAALGVNTAIFSLAFVVFNFLAYGTTPRVGRAVGEGDWETAGKRSVQALTLGAAAGLVAFLILELAAPVIVSAMGARGGLVDPALSYLRIRALAGPAVLLIMASHGVFRGYQDTRTPFAVTIGLNVINLVLDPILIFGLGWGLEGAAWATVVAQWAGALAFLRLLLASRREDLGIRLSLPRPRELLPFLRVSGELTVRTFALLGTLALATAVATRVGTVAVAAHQVASQLWLLLALTVDALAVAGQAMVAKYRGAGDPRSARAASNRLLAWGLGLGFALSALFFAMRGVLPRFFTDDAVVVDAVGGIMPFVIWMQPLNALVFVWDGVFLGAEQFRFLAVQMALSGLSAAAVLVLVLPFGWGLAGVWWGIVTLMAVRFLTLGTRYWQAGREPRASGV